jgi:hypothetical protein
VNYKAGDGNRSYTLMSRDTGTDARLARCELGAQLLFERLVRWTDNRGRTLADPALVANRVFARYPPAHKNVERWLNQLHEKGLAFLYEHRGEKYAIFPMFNKYNPIRGNMRSESDLPFPDHDLYRAWASEHDRDMGVIEDEISLDTCSNAFERVPTRMKRLRQDKSRQDNTKDETREPAHAVTPAEEERPDSPDSSYGDSDLDGFAGFWQVLTGHNLGTVGANRVRIRLKEGWTPILLQEAAADIVGRRIESKGDAPKFFTYVDNALDEWSRKNPNGISGRHSPPPKAKKEAENQIPSKQTEERKMERARVSLADELISRLDHDERSELQTECEQAVTYKTPRARKGTRIFDDLVITEMRASVLSDWEAAGNPPLDSGSIRDLVRNAAEVGQEDVGKALAALATGSRVDT